MRNYLLLTPGPLSTSETVKEAMLQDWCTWDKDYNEGIVTVIRKELLEVAGLDEKEYTTVLLQGSGTYGVEATLGAVVKPTDRLLIIANGAYGKRMAAIADYYKLDYVMVALKETELITPAIVEEALKNHPGISHLSLVHSETTTGLLNPIEEIAEVLRGRGITWIVDAMSSFGGIPIDMKKLGIDFLVSSANKCIQGVPGFTFVLASREKLLKCKGVARSLSLDIYAQWEEMEKGIEARYRRYCRNHEVLVEGMRAIGFSTLLEPEKQSPIITSFLYPEPGFSFTEFYGLLKQQGFVIYPGKVSDADTFRIGTIGDVFPEDFERLTQAVAAIRQVN